MTWLLAVISEPALLALGALAIVACLLVPVAWALVPWEGR